jgi:hypothetical protein
MFLRNIQRPSSGYKSKTSKVGLSPTFASILFTCLSIQNMAPTCSLTHQAPSELNSVTAQKSALFSVTTSTSDFICQAPTAHSHENEQGLYIAPTLLRNDTTTGRTTVKFLQFSNSDTKLLEPTVKWCYCHFHNTGLHNHHGRLLAQTWECPLVQWCLQKIS